MTADILKKNLINQPSQVKVFLVDCTERVAHINHKTNNIRSPINTQYGKGTMQNTMEQLFLFVRNVYWWRLVGVYATTVSGCDPWPILLQADSSCHAPHTGKTSKRTTAIKKQIKYLIIIFSAWLADDRQRVDPEGNGVSLSKVSGARSLLFARSSPSPAISLSSIFSISTPPRPRFSIVLKSFSLHLQHICNNQCELRGP